MTLVAATIFAILVAHTVNAADPRRACASDIECAVYHQGVCAAATGVGGPGVCVCDTGRGWHALLRACVPFETGTLFQMTRADSVNVSLRYTASAAGRFAPALAWPSDWTCDTQQCRATESDTLYVTWRRDLVVAAATASVDVVLAPSEVYIRCPPQQAYLRSASNAGSSVAGADVPAYTHCATCAQWCGSHSSACAGAGIQTRDPTTGITAPFTCACAPGWSGAQCDIETGSATADALVRTLRPVDRILRVPTDQVPLLASIAAVAFPVYDYTRTCALDANCATAERCYVAVPESVRLKRLRRACFCVPGSVPAPGLTSGCVSPSTGFAVVFGVTLATHAASTTGPTLIVPLVTPGGGGGNTATGYITTSTSSAGDVLVTPLAGASVTMTETGAALDATTAAYLRANPYWIACASDETGTADTTAPGGIFQPLVPGAVSPLQWCTTCTRACNPAGSTGCNATTGTCTCAPGFTGRLCAQCVANTTFVLPYCNDTATACAARQCQSHGVCMPPPKVDGITQISDTRTPTTCACDAEWTGPSCNVSARDCAQTSCSTRNGACTSIPGVCACDPARGFVGADCSVTLRACGTTLCAGHGACTSDLRCTCDFGWTGSSCAARDCANGGASLDLSDSAANVYTVCVCAAGWTGLDCRTSVCAPPSEPWRGHWDSLKEACVCGSVWHLNASTATASQCESHLCGPEGTPLGADFCECSGDTQFVAFVAPGSGEMRCQPLPPTRQDAVMWSVESTGGADIAYAHRDAVFSVLPCVTFAGIAALLVYSARRYKIK